MRINEPDQIDKFFKEFQDEIDTHFDKVFKFIDDLKMDSHQNHRKLSRQVINKVNT